MKEKILVLLCSIFLLSGCGTTQQISNDTYDNFVVEKDMSIQFYFGDRDGIYTGTINSAGLPDGFGKFENVSDSGNNWTYYGEWSNGHLNGNGITQWTDSSHTGLYEMDYMQGPGIYFYNDGSIFCGEFAKSEAATSYIPDTAENSDAAISNDSPLINNSSKNEFDAGVYKVGSTITSGEYVLVNNRTDNGSTAELEIDTDSSGQFSSIGLMIETNSFAYFSLQDDEYLNIKKGYVIPIEAYEKTNITSYQSIPSGMYIIGEDIPAGEYELKSVNKKSSCYTVYTEIPSSKDNIVHSLDYFDVNTFITLRNGDYILFKNSEMSLVNESTE